MMRSLPATSSSRDGASTKPARAASPRVRSLLAARQVVTV